MKCSMFSIKYNEPYQNPLAKGQCITVYTYTTYIALQELLDEQTQLTKYTLKGRLLNCSLTGKSSDIKELIYRFTT